MLRVVARAEVYHAPAEIEVVFASAEEPKASLGKILSQFDSFQRLPVDSLVSVEVESFPSPLKRRRDDETTGESWVEIAGSIPHAVLAIRSPSVNGISTTGITHLWTLCGQHYVSRPGEDWIAEWQICSEDDELLSGRILCFECGELYRELRGRLPGPNGQAGK